MNSDKRRRFCSKRCAKQYGRWRKRGWFAGWPTEAIPPELIRARRLYGQAIWLLKNRSAFLEHNP
jgi:hypothetical protein